MKNFIFGLLAAIIIGGVGLGAYFYGKQQSNVIPIPIPTGTVISVSPTQQPLVGNDSDVHGCKGSAGYTWCEVKNKCLRIWEEPCATPTTTENLVELIKQALIKKNNWTNMDIEVTINKNEGMYVSGAVKEKGSNVGGGYFFAAKVNGEWKIVADGNGTISCESLVPYPDYPVSMIPECWSEKTGKLVTR